MAGEISTSFSLFSNCCILGASPFFLHFFFSFRSSLPELSLAPPSGRPRLLPRCCLVKTRQLRFWCQYWIIVAIVTAVEKFAGPVISWLPMPFVMQYEPDIEDRFWHLRANSSEFLLFYQKNFTDKGTTLFLDLFKSDAFDFSPLTDEFVGIKLFFLFDGTGCVVLSVFWYLDLGQLSLPHFSASFSPATMLDRSSND